MEDRTMATITLEYDASSSFAVSFLDTLKKSGAFKIAKPMSIHKSEEAKEAKRIAQSVCGVRDGKIKTRPLSSLLNEL